ncbi:hypothetical protein OCS_00675 [Ophiocordyceps sinensis CO18]|uniref:Uncharacterized protein n=1 Tax=Ophiocordyceps sinensis (strain Co18 / CGMCC 3.14243) TaxID=911162 RepID=T5ADQ9_OPHSC|nr:hypothetical protein OCS_00675 [Ophiocordyceps sinensis CO18]
MKASTFALALIFRLAAASPLNNRGGQSVGNAVNTADSAADRYLGVAAQADNAVERFRNGVGSSRDANRAVTKAEDARGFADGTADKADQLRGISGPSRFNPGCVGCRRLR